MVILKKQMYKFLLYKTFSFKFLSLVLIQNVILGELEQTVLDFVGIQVTERIVNLLVIVIKRSAIRLMDVEVFEYNYICFGYNFYVRFINVLKIMQVFQFRIRMHIYNYIFLSIECFHLVKFNS